MDYYIGKSSAMCYAIESGNYGTVNPASTWAYAGKVQRWSDEDSQAMEPLNGMDDETGTRTIDEYYPMVPKFGGTLELLVQHMRFLGMGIGSDSYAAGVHTISIGSDIEHFDMQVKLNHGTNPFIRQYVGCMMNRVELTSNKGDWLRGSANIVAQNVTKESSFKSYQASVDSLKKYSVASMRPYRASDMTTTVNNVDISGYTQQARISIENDLLIDAGMDQSEGNFISEPAPQVAKITAGITLKMRSTDLWDLFKVGDEVENCSFKWTRGTDYINIPFTGARINKAGAPIDVGQGVVIQEVALSIPSITIEEKNSITTPYSTICA